MATGETPSQALDAEFGELIVPLSFPGYSTEDVHSKLSYWIYRKMGAEARLEFFKILLGDRASVWLQGQAETASIDSLLIQFKQDFISCGLEGSPRVLDVSAQSGKETFDECVKRIQMLGENSPLDEDVIRYAVTAVKLRAKEHEKCNMSISVQRMSTPVDATEIDQTELGSLQQGDDEAHQRGQQMHNRSIQTEIPKTISPEKVTFSENLTVQPLENASQNRRRFQLNSQTNRPCLKCGRCHSQRQCLAYGNICSICGKRGHFATLCRFGRYAKRR